ncbi:hypothetical protein GW765_01945 [Candidatus Parcubacteria bacterium]|uniref:Transmembrane protein n=1 Tax=Candidatus Magasanikbacteria bacterium CG10_big_fil_rev_8_21_14_0_10_38_6 TaxID=1974647 RepID=A0A2M6P205_9BACT|nr:hypothetical protein [Candidatus Parcubacteria bacterium]PIR77755.1 MAG: hypothetical protein COU30_00725 [Candidatus Magasanikbacteria bacterium CG10_big_fil_rev_8_21_14_0_10_38_6]
MNISKANNPTILVIFAFLMLILGLFIGKTIWSTNMEDRISNIVSCAGYDEDFLQEMDFSDRDDCQNLNISLHKQYIDDCLSNISNEIDEKYKSNFVQRCVYHKFEIDSVFLSAEYTKFIK